jgi:hypothetical protein
VLLSKVFRTFTHYEFVVACDASHKKQESSIIVFFVGQTPFLFLHCWLNLELLNSSAFFLGCRLNLGPFTYVFSLFVDGQIWALC